MAHLGRVRAVDKEEFNLSDPNAMRSFLQDYKPDIIVNAAAYTNVEKGEEERELAFQVNGVAPGILAEEAKKIGAIFVHYSTDYVFDGTSSKPYREDDTPNPLNAYGQSKLAGEKTIEAIGGKYLILRTSWIFGKRGKNFMQTMLNSQKEELKIVNDQIGAPTWCKFVAHATTAILREEKEVWGLFHLTAAGETSWCGFAREIFKMANKKKKVIPISSQEYPSNVKRPSYSVLSNQKIKNAFGISLLDWKTQLHLCLNEPPELRD
jgi:dTDP-4-dehydrorhamnose reductase